MRCTAATCALPSLADPHLCRDNGDIQYYALVRRIYCKLLEFQQPVLPSCSCQKVGANLPCKTAGPKAAQNVVFLAQPGSLGSWEKPGGGCENIFQDEKIKPNLTSPECQKQLDTNRMFRKNRISAKSRKTLETIPRRDEHKTIRFGMSQSVPSFCV